MASVDEWLAGETKDGVKLNRVSVENMRARKRNEANKATQVITGYSPQVKIAYSPNRQIAGTFIPRDGEHPCGAPCGQTQMVAPKLNPNGTGSILARYFSRLGYKAIEDTDEAKVLVENISLVNCQTCAELILEMDLRSSAWCELNLLTILKMIKANASRHKVAIFGSLDKVPYFNSVVTRFVKCAITEAKQFEIIAGVVNPPTITLSKIGSYTPTVEDIPTNRKPRLIITVGTGEHFQQVLQISERYLQRYADKCDADFIVLTNPTQSWPLYEKFRIKQFAEMYERTLFIDADCLIRESCPDLFDIVPVGQVGIHDDTGHNRNNDWLRRSHSAIVQSQGIVDRPLKNPTQTLNSGVVLCDRADFYIWTPPELPLPGRHEDEQIWIQTTIEYHDTLLFKLPRIFNEQWYFRDFKDNVENAQIIHFANCKTRLKIMPEYAKDIL